MTTSETILRLQEAMPVTVELEPGEMRVEASGVAMRFGGETSPVFAIDFGGCGTAERRRDLVRLSQGVQWSMTAHTARGDVRGQFLCTWTRGGRLVGRLKTMPTVDGRPTDLMGLAHALWGPRDA